MELHAGNRRMLHACCRAHGAAMHSNTIWVAPLRHRSLHLHELLKIHQMFRRFFESASGLAGKLKKRRALSKYEQRNRALYQHGE